MVSETLSAAERVPTPFLRHRRPNMTTAPSKPTRLRPVIRPDHHHFPPRHSGSAVQSFTTGPNGRIPGSRRAIARRPARGMEERQPGGIHECLLGIRRVILISGDTHLAGCQAVFQHYQERYQSKGQEMGTLTLKGPIQMLDSGHALAWGEWQVVTSGQKHSGRFSRIYKKLSSGWRIIHESTTM